MPHISHAPYILLIHLTQTLRPLDRCNMHYYLLCTLNTALRTSMYMYVRRRMEET